MSEQPYLDPERRHDFVFLFDVQDGNPNGDPDAGNLPRVDPETMQGLVTDVCIKRKVRNFVQASGLPREHHDVFIKANEALNTSISEAYRSLQIDLAAPPRDEADGKKRNKEGVAQGQEVDEGRRWMCNRFYDVRTFGAVMTTGPNAGQVRGPMQLTFARSIDPIIPLDLSITRIAITRPEDEKETEMGRKALVPYGLYRGVGFYNPMLARQTGFDGEDLRLFWQALQMCWDLDRSASRGLMALRGLYVFSHDSPLGNAPAHLLLDRVQARRKPGVDVPRAFTDYKIDVNGDGMPLGVTMATVIGTAVDA